jgi:hypothetical protein
MATIIIVESLDKHGSVQQRDFVENLPYTIGRGYQNDLILDDDFVSPAHLKVDLDMSGNLVAIDCRSKNGLYFFQNTKRVDVAKIESGTELRIGHSRLRMRKADYQVSPPLQDALHDHILSRVLNNNALFWAIWCCVLLIIGIEREVANYNDDSLLLMLDELIPDVMRLMIWVGMWVMINRSITHATNLAAHLFVASLGYAGLILLDGLNGYLSYMFSLGDSVYILDYVVTVLLIMSVFYGHLRFCSLATTERVLMTATAVALGTVGLVWFSDLVEDPFSRNVDFAVNLKPPAFNIVVSDDLNQFFVSSAVLKEKVDEEVAQSKEAP